jgi:hypothetical protein
MQVFEGLSIVLVKSYGEILYRRVIDNYIKCAEQRKYCKQIKEIGEIRMNKKSILLMLLLTLPLMAPLIARNATAYSVTGTPSTNPKIIEWTSGGLDVYKTLKWNPEYLKVQVDSPVWTTTTIIIQGKDTMGANIEAKVVILPSPYTEFEYIFNDTHTTPPMPVAFAEITGIFQQGGTDNSKFEILTSPEPFEEYLGQYHLSTGFEPGKYTVNGDNRYYLVGHGADKPYTVQNVPVEPSNPDPLKILVNWIDAKNLLGVYDLLPQANELGKAKLDSTVAAGTAIYLESLDENGNKVITTVEIPAGANGAFSIVGCTYSTLCKVWGGNQADSYYIFSEPMLARELFFYYIKIDHITIHPAAYDILANPQDANGEGMTKVTVALRDIDGNLVNAADYLDTIPEHDTEIIINFFTSGGIIEPARTMIEEYDSTVTVLLHADTNARTINVTADANIPVCTYHDELNLPAWTEMTLDGVNSVFSNGGVLVHAMMNSYTDVVGNTVTTPVPAKPVLPPSEGGPNADGIKLDGPIYEVSIPLYVGCNLISSPVSPLLGDIYYTNYPTAVAGAPGYNTGIDNKGIPMDLLFSETAAVDNIEAVWWYDGIWHVYIPGQLDPTAYFRDGVGYWIKAEKPATLEISGVWMENGPFTPPTYNLNANAWNLMGVTSLNGITVTDYLSSISGSQYIQGAGPVWVYYAHDGRWVRNPSWGLWPGEAFWVYNKLPTPENIAP